MVVANENAEEAEGVSEGGLEAKENPEDADPNAVDPPRENADGAEGVQVDGTEKVKLDEDDAVGFVGAAPNGAAEKEGAGAGVVETAAGVRPRLENVAGADGTEAATLGAGVAKDPGMGSLSPSKVSMAGAETSCLTPGLRLSMAKGQRSPSVESMSMTGAGGRVFSSVM